LAVQLSVQKLRKASWLIFRVPLAAASANPEANFNAQTPGEPVAHDPKLTP
jgi:hypothetical protein